MTDFPEHWAKFIEINDLIDSEITIPEEADHSGIGAELQVMNLEHAKEEANDLYPGIAASPAGYIPVCSCSIGCGDPYFIRTTDAVPGPLYRIYHDACDETGLADDAVVVVLESYFDLVQYKDA